MRTVVGARVAELGEPPAVGMRDAPALHLEADRLREWPEAHLEAIARRENDHAGGGIEEQGLVFPAPANGRRPWHRDPNPLDHDRSQLLAQTLGETRTERAQPFGGHIPDHVHGDAAGSDAEHVSLDRDVCAIQRLEDCRHQPSTSEGLMRSEPLNPIRWPPQCACWIVLTSVSASSHGIQRSKPSPAALKSCSRRSSSRLT